MRKADLLTKLGAGLAILWACCGRAHGKDVIHWGVFERPPLFIVQGEAAGSGTVDRVRRMIFARLPAYQHDEVQAPIARIQKEIQAQKNWCVAGLQKSPERDGYAATSLPMFLHPAHRLITRREDAARFGSDASRSLETLLGNAALRSFVERGRSYNATIDEMLAKHPDVGAFSPAQQGVLMLLAGRLDYLLELESTARYYAARSGDPDSLASLSFKEMTDTMVLRVLCPRNDWGRKVIEAVNRALLAIRPTPAFQRLLEENLDAPSATLIRQQAASKLMGAE